MAPDTSFPRIKLASTGFEPATAAFISDALTLPLPTARRHVTGPRCPTSLMHPPVNVERKQNTASSVQSPMRTKINNIIHAPSAPSSDSTRTTPSTPADAATSAREECKEVTAVTDPTCPRADATAPPPARRQSQALTVPAPSPIHKTKHAIRQSNCPNRPFQYES